MNSESENASFQSRLFFENRHIKYIYFENLKAFRALEYSIEDMRAEEILSRFKNSFDVQSVREKRKIFGKCLIEIPIIPLYAYLADVLTQGFFFFQYFTMVIWIIQVSIYFSFFSPIPSEGNK